MPEQAGRKERRHGKIIHFRDRSITACSAAALNPAAPATGAGHACPAHIADVMPWPSEIV